MKQQHDVQRRAQAEWVYTQFLRLYPRAHQQAFGEPMLQAFRDHYCDAIKTEGEHTARFWLRVVGDEGKSLLREHMAAFWSTCGALVRGYVSPLTAVNFSMTCFIHLKNRVVGLSSYLAPLFLLLCQRVQPEGTANGFRSIAQAAFPEQIQRPLSRSRWL
jgi:hypothetical protein